MAGDDVNPGQIVGRRVLSSRYLRLEGNKTRVLLPAFEELRVTPFSLDSLWPENSGEAKRQARLIEATDIARAESHSVLAWASFKVKEATRQKFVESVVHAPTAINAEHLHLHFVDGLRVEQGDVGSRAKVKAWVLAKLMAEFHAEHGSVESVVAHC